MTSNIAEKNYRGLSSCSGCVVFKCLANYGGFIRTLVNISKQGWDHERNVVEIMKENLYFK